MYAFQFFHFWPSEHLGFPSCQSIMWTVVRKVEDSLPICSQRKRLLEMKFWKWFLSSLRTPHLNKEVLVIIMGNNSLPGGWNEWKPYYFNFSFILFTFISPNFCWNSSKLLGRSVQQSEIARVLWCWKSYLVFGVFKRHFNCSFAIFRTGLFFILQSFFVFSRYTGKQNNVDTGGGYKTFAWMV